MGWEEIRSSYRNIRECSDGPIGDKWQIFSEAVMDAETPYHIAILLERIKQYQGSRDPHEIKIFDHGCGGGLTLIYLAALGYTEIYGVDINLDFTPQNRIMSEIFGIKENRFFSYNGSSIGIPDSSVDIIFSQQVIEHVSNEFFESYFLEERRILKPGGWAIHQIPHRLVPYDSHTNTWFIHYFPHTIAKILASLIGITIPSHLHLRWPWQLRSILNRHIGKSNDLTLDRLIFVKRPSYYDGSKLLRNIISDNISLPIIGPFFGRIISQFVMMESLSVSNKDNP